MQSFTRIISFLLLLIVPAFASFADYYGNFDASLNKRAAANCKAIPCSGNTTCVNYACGYCMSDYCQPETAAMSMSKAAAAATASSAAAAMATAMPTMAASDAGRNGMVGSFVVAAAGVAAAGLL